MSFFRKLFNRGTGKSEEDAAPDTPPVSERHTGSLSNAASSATPVSERLTGIGMVMASSATPVSEWRTSIGMVMVLVLLLSLSLLSLAGSLS